MRVRPTCAKVSRSESRYFYDPTIFDGDLSDSELPSTHFEISSDQQAVLAEGANRAFRIGEAQYGSDIHEGYSAAEEDPALEEPEEEDLALEELDEEDLALEEDIASEESDEEETDEDLVVDLGDGRIIQGYRECRIRWEESDDEL